VCYIKVFGNHAFLNDKISTLGGRGLQEVEYVENTLVTSYRSLLSQLEILDLEKDLEIMDQFCSKPTVANFNKFSDQAKLDLFEKAFEDSFEHPDLPLVKTVYDQYSDSVFEVKEGSGIWIHILYKLQKFRKGEYAKGKEKLLVDGRTRIYRPKKGWSWLTDPKEEKEYMEIITKERKQTRADVAKESPFGFYGTLTPKGQKLKLIFPGKTGMVFSSFPVPELRELLVKNIGYDVFSGPPENIPATFTKEADRKKMTVLIKEIDSLDKEDLRERIVSLEKESKDKLLAKGTSTKDMKNIYFFLSVTLGKNQRAPLAKYIQAALEKEGLMVD
jgi:hypothetical protein